MIAQIPLTRQEEEVKRLEQCLFDSVSDPSEAVHFAELLQIAVWEKGRLHAAFDRDFGPPNADANGAAMGATALCTQTGHSTAQMLLNGAGVVDVTEQSRIPGLSLNPSTPTFQPVIGD